MDFETPFLFGAAFLIQNSLSAPILAGHDLAATTTLTAMVALLRKLITEQPGDQSLLISLGTALNNSGKEIEAKQCYQATTGTGPEKVTALAGLAALENSIGDTAAAETARSESLAP